jgi:hypothetical protein
MEKLNIASKQEPSRAERKRIPMSVPVMSLEVPEIPGYSQYWFEGTPERIQRALDGGYEFVDEREVRLNNVSLGGNSAASGNTDMGSRVSVLAGQEVGTDGQAIRLVLMKIRQEWKDEDDKLIEDRNTAVRNALLGGMIGAERDASGDTAARYVDKARLSIPKFFERKT